MTDGSRAKPGRKPDGTRKIALNLRLDPEIHKQLKLHALLADSTASEIVTSLVRQHLKVYTVKGG